LTALWRAVRYRLIVPVFRSRHPPEYTARGVANGVFWGLTPFLGLQTIAIATTWVVGRKVFRKDASLLQALIWVWVNNPVTMVPMYYVFYLTGAWLMGDVGLATGYDGFLGLWNDSAAGWLDRVAEIARAVGVATVLGSIPYAAVASVVSYRWAVGVVRRRKSRLQL
jgi:uncharacterized protein (DUF2062 family)